VSILTPGFQQGPNLWVMLIGGGVIGAGGAVSLAARPSKAMKKQLSLKWAIILSVLLNVITTIIWWSLRPENGHGPRRAQDGSLPH
jgi:hypothetical protein